MTIKYFSLLIFISLVMALACTPEKKETSNIDEVPVEERTEKALLDEVIEIHDEVMPRIENIVMLQGKLQRQLDSLSNANGDAQKIAAIREKISNLKKADSAMMSWMRQFKPVKDTSNHEQRIHYLEKERERISRVKEMMNTAIEEAQQIAN